MKKSIISILLALLFTFSFVGCVGQREIENPGDDYEVNVDMTDEDYNQTATLTVGVTPDPFEADLIEQVAEGFKEMFPNVTVEITRITGSNYITDVDKLVKLEKLPDIIYTSETESFSFISSGYFLNLKPYINAMKANDPSYEEQFVAEAWKMGQKNYDGDQYVIPRSSDRIVTHLNKTYTDAAIEYWNETYPDDQLPTDIIKNGWTWDDFLAVCEALRQYYDSNGWTAGNGRYLVDHTFTWAPVMFSLFRSMDVQICDENGKWTFDSDAMESTVAMVRNLIDKKYIAPSNGGGANYENGNGAMLFHTSSAIKKYSGYIGEGYDIVTFPLINGEKGVFGFGIPGYGINAEIAAEKRDLAWQFLNYITMQEGQNILAKAGMNTPSIRNDLSDYNTAEWGNGYRHLNLEATVWEGDRNYSEDFFLRFDASKKTTLVGDFSSFMLDITSCTGGKFDYTVENCLEELTKNLNKHISK
jgi:lipoprotein